MKCPVCAESLIVVERQRIELDYCPWCRGLWFDAGELALLAETFQRPLVLPESAVQRSAESTEHAYPCPRCDVAMEKIAMGTGPQVVVDRCPKGDGLWFDHGELGSLMGQVGGSHVGAVIHFMGETFGGSGPGAADAATREEEAQR